MNPAAPFIARPIGTTLLTLGALIAGSLAYFFLPVAPLPQVDFPTILVMASLPGASPETMATSVATPLERHLGQIADVTEMSSSSSVGQTRVTLQFGLDRNIDGAARDVQAAINAARADLPSSLKSNPTYRKMNPADAPIMILALTSDSMPREKVYDVASTILQQKIAQVSGIGQVVIGGSSLPAVRVALNAEALTHHGISLEDVRAALASANAFGPKGIFESEGRSFQILTNDQARRADDYRDLIIGWRDNAPVRLSDVATLSEGMEDVRNLGLYNGHPAIPLILFKQPGSNIIETVDAVKAILPELRASVPAAVSIDLAMDRTTTIRASLADVERTLLISIALVILVVYLFLGSKRATLIPSVAVPVSLAVTFGVMYLVGYSLDNLSLMALIVSTGFVVDDAIVVLENVTRHIEAGMPRREAALRGAGEVGFTVLSMSLSLIAVFVPIFLMGGIVGRLFREFAATLSIAILASLVISLTATPMMCAYLLPRHRPKEGGKKPGLSSRALSSLQAAYGRSLGWALAHPKTILLILGLTVALNVKLFMIVPKGFFPQQDTGMMMGNVQADQSISFQAMKEKLRTLLNIVMQDQAVERVIAFTGGGQTNDARMFATLKPLAVRKIGIEQVMARLRGKLSNVPGASLFFQAVQDLGMGGRASSAQYQYTLQSDDLAELRLWTPRLAEALRHEKILADVNSDQQEGGLETEVTYDRDTLSRLGLTVAQVNQNLYDAFGQRQVSTIYNPLNQYHVVMGFDASQTQNPDGLKALYIGTSGAAVSGSASTSATLSDAARNKRMNQLANVAKGTGSSGSAVSIRPASMVPLESIASFSAGQTPLSVNHQGHFAAATISFNLVPGKSLSDATLAVHKAEREIGMPATVRGGFQGSAKMFQDALQNEGLLVIAALLAVYIVLGILYESTIHPLTILSTLPSAGVGAVLALMLCGQEFSIIALIGVILLIGIVKKNAIMMIDFALTAEREEGLDTRSAIYQACLLRFRPIMMTTMAALLGALPLALGTGDGAELRRPLGISIVGGLILSQVLTLYTTPVIYLFLDRFRPRSKARHEVPA